MPTLVNKPASLKRKTPSAESQLHKRRRRAYEKREVSTVRVHLFMLELLCCDGAATSPGPCVDGDMID